MHLRPIVVVSVVALSVTACATQEDAAESDGTWVGTITTEGNVTTVVNESGSVWGGTARLVEEASIGVESGDDEYMLGAVAGVAATSDKIFVIDRQLPALRAYDHRGTHLYDIGAHGQGPGEFQAPSSVAVASDGRVFLRDEDSLRILIYDGKGEYLGAYEMTGGLHTARPMTVSSDGDVPYSEVLVGRDDPSVFVTGMQGHGENGPEGDPIMPAIDPTFVPRVVSAANRGSSMTYLVPFSPDLEWALTPALDVIFGVSDTYRFEVRHADGSLSVIQRISEPVPVDSAEADWNKRRVTARMRSMLPGWVWGDAPAIPSNKPAYDEFIPTRSGTIWVLRAGPGIRLPQCDDQAETPEEFAAFPCWRDQPTVDVFGSDGRFLGSIETPAEMHFSPRPYIDGDMVIARAEDEAGTIMVKRYRLVLPGER